MKLTENEYIMLLSFCVIVFIICIIALFIIYKKEDNIKKANRTKKYFFDNFHDINNDIDNIISEYKDDKSLLINQTLILLNTIMKKDMKKAIKTKRKVQKLIFDFNVYTRTLSKDNKNRMFSTFNKLNLKDWKYNYISLFFTYMYLQKVCYCLEDIKNEQ